MDSHVLNLPRWTAATCLAGPFVALLGHRDELGCHRQGGGRRQFRRGSPAIAQAFQGYIRLRLPHDGSDGLWCPLLPFPMAHSRLCRYLAFGKLHSYTFPVAGGPQSCIDGIRVVVRPQSMRSKLSDPAIHTHILLMFIQHVEFGSRQELIESRLGKDRHSLGSGIGIPGYIQHTDIVHYLSFNNELYNNSSTHCFRQGLVAYLNCGDREFS